MNRKQKIIKKTAKRAKARLNKHTPPTIKKYVSKAERTANQALKEKEALLNPVDDASPTPTDEENTNAEK
ncbi:DUF2986 domain-containing protein [Shewanella surugensis]|uniref:DUF2986 domain-containing protein n=1 Tax=Shewanella surugensis TaxID=212020 RepID=A0ABT0LAZ3_9GAMM|nr:DUF2986 domain-containing protein [Shewanella surugensis]MCL1124341.1 DUF2986 domain-containing protein [Shewanella surugensis]